MVDIEAYHTLNSLDIVYIVLIELIYWVETFSIYIICNVIYLIMLLTNIWTPFCWRNSTKLTIILFESPLEQLFIIYPSWNLKIWNACEHLKIVLIMKKIQRIYQWQIQRAMYLPLPLLLKSKLCTSDKSVPQEDNGLWGYWYNVERREITMEMVFLLSRSRTP
jgi:hypothetical protein